MTMHQQFSRGPSPLERATSCPAIICHSTINSNPFPVKQDSHHHCKKRRRHSWSCFDTTTGKLVLSDDQSSSLNNGDARSSTESSAFRKARVAITGGTLTAVGLVMIPLPIPMGFVVAGAGLAHLGQEFPGAQRMLDNTKERVVGAFQTRKDDKQTQPPMPTVNATMDANNCTAPSTPEVQKQTKQAIDVLVESPKSIRSIWELYDDDDYTSRFDGPGFQEEEVMVNVWHA